MARSFGAEALGADGFAVRGPVSAAPGVGCALVELGSNQLGWTSAPVALNSDLSLKANRSGDTFTGDVAINRLWTSNPIGATHAFTISRQVSGAATFTDNTPLMKMEHIANVAYPYSGFVINHNTTVPGANPGGSYLSLGGPTNSFGLQFDYLANVGTPNYQGDVRYMLTGAQSKHIFQVNTGATPTEVGRFDANGLTVPVVVGAATNLDLCTTNRVRVRNASNTTNSDLEASSYWLSANSTNRITAPNINTVDVRADSGLRVRNAANNADAALTAGAGTFSGNLTFSNQSQINFPGTTTYIGTPIWQQVDIRGGTGPGSIISVNSAGVGSIVLSPHNNVTEIQTGANAAQEFRVYGDYQASGATYRRVEMKWNNVAGGYIGTRTNSGVYRMCLGFGDSPKVMVDTDGSWAPYGQAAFPLGNTTNMWSDVYHRGSYINYNAGMSGLVNYERGYTRWDSNTFQIGVEAGGTGTQRNIEIKRGTGSAFASGASLRVISGGADVRDGNGGYGSFQAAAIIANNGAASNPSIYFSNGPQSGMYCTGTTSGTRGIGISTDGGSALILDGSSTGRIARFAGSIALPATGAMSWAGDAHSFGNTWGPRFSGLDSTHPLRVIGGSLVIDASGSTIGDGTSAGIGNLWLSGTITQGAQDARWTVTATGKRDSQVGNGSGTWQTGYREEYNAGGVRAGFFGATPVTQQSIAAAATDPATTQTLANSLRTAMLNLGLGV